jgi:4-hydroxy-3-methylbut-2-enyl diphosphate reductase
MGQLPEGAVTLIETLQDVETLTPKKPEALAFVTQTTLSVDDTAEIVAALKQRFPAIQSPRKEDICYATTNRQAAVKEIAGRCDALIVVGSPNSSNSQRLVDVAEGAGCQKAWLIQSAAELAWSKFGAISTLGITAGASAPEILVEEIIGVLKQRFEVSVEVVRTANESISFKLPRQLRSDAAE